MHEVAKHKDPVWEAKANSILNAKVQGEIPDRIERLWARRLQSNAFEICCIPFFTYGIALADIVEANDEYVITRTIQKSGHSNLRIAIADFAEENSLHVVLHEWADRTEQLYEWYAAGYLALDVPPDVLGKLDLSVLEELMASNRLYYEID